MRSLLNALQEGRLFELPDADKARALEFLARIIDANPDIEVGTDAIEAIQQRERECNTGIGLGVGVPHLRAGREEGILFSAIGWSKQGIDYGSADGGPVHLVFMYYIPGSQKHAYLKEVSLLFKAIRKSSGIAPVLAAADLNVVRNLLLDWVSAGLGDTGPETVARMIKLEVKHAQSEPRPAVLTADGSDSAVPGPAKVETVLVFDVLVIPSGTVAVLAQDAAWTAALEAVPNLPRLLLAGHPFVAGERRVFVAGTTVFPAGRILHHCVGVGGGAPS